MQYYYSINIILTIIKEIILDILDNFKLHNNYIYHVFLGILSFLKE